MRWKFFARYGIQAHIFAAVLVLMGLLSPIFLSAESELMKKVALVFLTRNGVNHPTLWKNLIQTNSDKFNVYIFSKNPLEDHFFNSFRLEETVPTQWDYHILAWQLLLKKAYQDPENYKFVYLSESCVPIRPLEEIYQTLTSNDTSYMCFAGPWWPKDSPREVLSLPVEHRFGNHEWVILNRRHAEMIVEDKAVIDIVSRCWIDSESYPSTLFSVNGCLGEFCNRTSTYVNWNLAEGGGAHPYHFRDDSPFNRDMLLKAKESGHFFARKFTPTFPEDAIFQIMITNP